MPNKASGMTSPLQLFAEDSFRFHSALIRMQRTTCIKQGFWPPLKPKTESYFKTFAADCFIR